MLADTWWQLILLGVLLAASSFFSAAETALTSLSRIRLRHLVEAQVRGAQVVNELVKNSRRMLGSILVGNNVVNIGASALATSLAISYFGTAGVGIATAAMTLLVLVLGEITPKSLASQNAEKMAFRVAGVISLAVRLLGPVVTVLLQISNLIILLVGGRTDRQKPFITEEELKTIVNVSREEGVLEGEETEMIHNVFDFGDSQVREVMTPRIDLAAVEVGATYEELLAAFRRERFSRLPVYEHSLDNIIGIVYLKDLIFLEKYKGEFDLRKILREPFFTYEFKRTADLFQEMRAQKVPLAIVYDEYGSVVGLVTIEDLVEEIVGDINDEYDEEESPIKTVGTNEYLVDGSTRLDVVNETLGTNLESTEFDSIGGFVLGEFGRFPDEGAARVIDNIKIIVEDVERNRVKRLRVKILSD